MSDDGVSYVVAAFRGCGRKRSRVYTWLLDHYTELAKAREGNRRVDWGSAAAEMNSLGLRVKGGRVLKPETVRRTWFRVEADVKAGVVSPRKPAPDQARVSAPRDFPRKTPRAPAAVEEYDDPPFTDVSGKPI
jgi:hypothetical protein